MRDDLTGPSDAVIVPEEPGASGVSLSRLRSCGVCNSNERGKECVPFSDVFWGWIRWEVVIKPVLCPVDILSETGRKLGTSLIGEGQDLVYKHIYWRVSILRTRLGLCFLEDPHFTAFLFSLSCENLRNAWKSGSEAL